MISSKEHQELHDELHHELHDEIQGEIQGEINSMPLSSREDMERFLTVIEKSARQWHVVVYPSLVAFVILAAFGFYLIYSLTSDIRLMARAIDPNMGHHMARMTDSMQRLSVDIKNMSSDMKSLPPMLAHMEKMDVSVQNMASYTGDMNHSMRNMTVSNDQMRHSMAQMTNNVARPMSVFNRFMPW